MNTASFARRMFVRNLAFAGLLFTASAAWAADDVPTPSLLPQSSLETPNADGNWAQGWSKAKNITWIEEEGNHFFRLTAVPHKQVGLYMSAPMTTEIKALEFSFRARVTGLERGSENWFDARVILNFKDGDGKRTPAPKLPYFSKDTDGWVTVTRLIRVPENAVMLELMPSLFKAAAGEFDIDDIVLKPIDPSLVP